MLEEVENNLENKEIDIEKQPPFKRFPNFKDWIYRLILFLIGMFGLDIVSTIIVLIVQTINPELLNVNSDLYITGNMLVNTIRYMLLIIVMAALLSPRLAIIGKKFMNWKTDLIGLGMGFALVGITILYNFIIGQFIDFGTNENELLAEQMIVAYPVLSVLVLGLVGPICEEVTYRYGLFDCINKKNVVLAYIVTALVFAIIHFDFTGDMKTELLNLPSYIIAGIVLTFTYHKFGFNASIIAHITNNMYAIITTIITQ